MKLHPPFSQPDPGRRAEAIEEEAIVDPLPDAYEVAAYRAEEDLPSIEEFVDDLPSIDEFVDDRRIDAAEGWAAADWQSFDWGGAASLGTPPKEAAQAQAAWSRTDWGGAPSSGTYEQSGADEIAAALDSLAHRIRTGQLSLDRLRGTPPEAAFAAAFAALLRDRA